LIAWTGGLLLAAAAFQIGLGDSARATAPNVVMFLADDMGWTDWQYDATLNPTGSVVYETPNLMRLAQQSVNFTSAYAPAPVCSPTRAAILTGKSPARLQITNILPSSPFPSANLKEPSQQGLLPGNNVQPNFVKVLQNNGYGTGLFGKWHLGSTAPTCACYGFDVNVGGSDLGSPANAGGWYAGSDGMWPDMPGLNTPGQFPVDTYLSDAITQMAGNYIQQNVAQAKPFFLANWDYQVHTPLQAPQNLIDKYTAKIQTLQGQGVDLKGQTNATYAAMVEKMDGDVGALLDRLDDPNHDGNKADSVLNNTVFIFSSDNGGEYAAEGSPTRNLPLREGKGSLYEGGIREPLLISYGADANIHPGTISTVRTSLYDLYPTILDLTGLTGAAAPNNTIDGVSIRSAIEGGTMDRGLLYWHYPHRSTQSAEVPSQITGGAYVSAVSDKDWKLIFFYDDRHYELYNITNDIGETTNLINADPLIAYNLSKALRNYLVGVNASMPLDRTTSVAVAPPPIFGDYDGNNVIDLNDYNFWRANYGLTTPAALAADGNHNGIVDTADYVFWRTIYAAAGSGTSIGVTGTVPEPTSALLVTLMAVFFSAFSVRTRGQRAGR
jgi:arylsulfatase A-like enzyme